MAWFMRGVQSAVFHYASCAPCTGYTDGRKRRKAAKQAKKVREKLQLEDPESYYHPEPTGTNPYWGEEIAMGPGPPPRRARRTNTGNTSSTRGITTAETRSSAMSKGGSSLDVARPGDMRLSDDTLEDDNWNRKRYQREDEDLWGHEDPPIPLQHTLSGSSVGVAGFPLRRPATSTTGSYYSARAPPVNELHPPVVSLPSPDPADNRWMLQPPPKASVMSGKERASNRSRSGSGASSRVELSLQRQLNTKQVQQRLERGETPELPSISPMSSYSNLVAGQRHDKSHTPQARPPSSNGSKRRKKKRDTTVSRTDTAMTRTDTMSTHHSSGDSSDTIVRGRPVPRTAPIPDIEVTRVRQNRPCLSTIVSSGSGANDLSLSSVHGYDRLGSSDQNALLELPTPVHHRVTSTPSSDSTPYLMNHDAPLSSSDISSLNVLQDLVSPRALLNSRFVSAPLVEAKIRLPPSAENLKRDQVWNGSRFGVSRGWDAGQANEQIRVPFDNLGPPHRDPRLRWSVDF
ncbi:uncharacterized protein K460DRAFT_406817 [Cucurbitaria berberidis CBS 394.84]|uniref:Signal peptide-containing protein n=1 Tax=Cucurbitaria berberidis CBS 394.84 TaxID=1168544 RepID=A0A9P4L8Z1_9PLEO|nr:uncharacterized protein K460DRAFT_406817 [Cucurbitaria berberidis CBS 394.84]KAF1846621.1 hypothetical protein K460DRAFT_406817 [Cucurbitaria berberidis CBS 394.84]